MSDFKEAKIGDRLYSLKLGWVTVTDVLSVGIYCVADDCERTELWYFDGNQSLMDKTPDLYWDKPTIIVPSKPSRLGK